MINTPTCSELESLLGFEKYKAFQSICDVVESLYDMETVWDNGGKAWKFNLRYRRGGKTLCTICMRENELGFMVIFGKDERAKLESIRDAFPTMITQTYDDAHTYHDGKWVLFELPNENVLESAPSLLAIKRKPNRKNKETI